MKGRRARDLVNGELGLNDVERLGIVEKVLLGEVGLEQQVEVLRRRVDELESNERRRRIGWIGRLFLGRKESNDGGGELQSAPGLPRRA